MLRKLGIGFTTLAALGPGIAAALGVGDYQLYSYLNQPLRMEVELRDLGDLSPDELMVKLASDADYARAGVERLHFHSALQFEVETQADGSGSINIRSAQAVREPYLNFLVEIHWPTGRLLREYTVLLDPPSYAQAIAVERSIKSETIVTPVAPIPSAREQAPASGAEAEPRPATAKAPQRRAPQHQQYQVQPSDTMWSIATRYRPDTSVSVQQMLVAIQELNPDAFINGNVNLVREGAVLRIPVEEEMRRIQARDAISEVATQNQRWEDMLEARGIAIPRAPLDTRPEKEDDAVSASDSPEATTGQVTLVSPETSGVNAAGGAGGVDESAGSDTTDARLRNQLVSQQENLEKLQRENRELGSRLSDLERQVATGDQLLRLRNDQIARLQDELRKLRDSAESSGVQIEAADPTLMEQIEDPEQQITAVEEGIADTSTSSPSAGADEGASESATDADSMKMTDATSGTPVSSDVEVAAPVTPDRPQVVEAPAGKEPTLVDLIVANMMFLLALVLVLLLAIVAVVLRRRKAESALSDEASSLSVGVASHEDAEAQDWESDAADEASPSGEAEDQDPLEQVEVYVAYGQFPQAIGYLRNEIASAPDRGDLKVRLFELLAQSGDKDGFDVAAEQYSGSDTTLDQRIDELRSSFAGGDEPSLDDLEMDLSSNLEADYQADEVSSSEQDDQAASDLLEDEFELTLDDEVAEDSDEDATVVGGAPIIEDEGQSLDDLGDFELDLDGDHEAQLGSSEGEMEFELDLDADLDDVDLAESEFSASEDKEEVAEIDLDLEVEEDDDAGLPEARSEVDEDEEQTIVASPAIALDDASDAFTADDTQAFEEVALDDVSDEFAGTESQAEELEDDLDLSLDDLELDQPTRRDAPALEVDDAETDATVEQPALDSAAEAVLEDDTVVDQPAVKADADETAVTTAMPDITDDDDFSFLGDADENATKLDLAKAYIDMGDKEGAKDILSEVLSEGSPEQQAEARTLIDQV